MVIFATLFRRCPTLWKLTLKMTTLFRRCPTLWKLTLKMTTLFRRCLTLFNSTLKYTTLLNVVDFNVDVRNVVSTLIWRCATSRCHINLKTTLNQCWFRISHENCAKFTRSYENYIAVVLTNHCQNYTAFLLNVRCSKWPSSFFCSCLSPMIVHLRNLFLLSTRVARMLLTPRWVSRRKNVK